MTLLAPSTRTTSAPLGGADHAPDRRRLALPYWLSGSAAILLVVASAAGLFVPGLYRDAPAWIAQTRGTDLVTLMVAVPALAASLILAARGSMRAQIVWLGALGYVLYMYAIYAFDVVFNPLFLVYVAVLPLSLVSLVAVLAQMDADSGIWLWQRRSRGYLLAGVILTTMTIMGVSVVSGTLFEYVDDPKMSLGAVPLLVVVTLAGLWLMVVYLRHLRPRPRPAIRSPLRNADPDHQPGG